MSTPIDVREEMTAGYTGRYSLDSASVIGIAVHHSVSGGAFFDTVPDTQEQELAHLQVIDQYHVAQGWGGFGYHLAAFPSGRSYYCGDLSGARAHVASRNNQLIGVVLIGDFTSAPPPAASLAAAQDAIAFVLQTYPDRHIDAHRNWALPQYPTACPGDTWAQWLPQLSGPPKEVDMTEEQVRQIFREMHAAAHATPAPPRTYTVQDGDNLWSIARDQLHDANRWPEIAALNGLSDPWVIHSGQLLTLP